MSRVLSFAAVALLAFLCTPQPFPVAEPDPPRDLPCELVAREPRDIPEGEFTSELLGPYDNYLNSLSPEGQIVVLDRRATDEAITADRLGPPRDFASSQEKADDTLEPEGIPIGGIGDPPPPGPFPATSFVGRFGATRYRLLREDGGNVDTERARALALAWLARQQKEDGGWEFDRGVTEDRVAATGLVLLTFLGAGETHKTPSGHPDYKYRGNVSDGLSFLMKRCPPSGPNAGRISTNMPSQALATLALVEAYAMTGDPVLKPYAQAALNYLQRNQGKDGGWGEAPGASSDSFSTDWAMQALFAGRQSKELIIDDRVVKKAVKFLDSLAVGSRKSMYPAFAEADAKPGTTPTAAGLLCRHCFDAWGPSHPGMLDGVAGLMKNPPTGTNRDPLYLYYATRVVWGSMGEDWKEWNEGPKQADGTRKGGVRDVLARSQVRKDGPALGSWDPEGDIGWRYGRVGTTALHALTLEVYYRYLPLYKRGADGNAVKILEDK